MAARRDGGTLRRRPFSLFARRRRDALPCRAPRCALGSRSLRTDRNLATLGRYAVSVHTDRAQVLRARDPGIADASDGRDVRDFAPHGRRRRTDRRARSSLHRAEPAAMHVRRLPHVPRRRRAPSADEERALRETVRDERRLYGRPPRRRLLALGIRRTARRCTRRVRSNRANMAADVRMSLRRGRLRVRRRAARSRDSRRLVPLLDPRAMRARAVPRARQVIGEARRGGRGRVVRARRR